MWFNSRYKQNNKYQDIIHSSNDKCKNFIIEHKRAVCCMTSERDECTCKGNQAKCDFYMRNRNR